MISNPQRLNASHHPDDGFHTLTTQPPKNGNEEANTSNPQTNLGTDMRAKAHSLLFAVLIQKKVRLCLRCLSSRDCYLYTYGVA